MTTDIILNAIAKLEGFADAYKKDKSAQNLASFLHYRTEFMELISFLWIEEIAPEQTTHMIGCYASLITDELGVFDIMNIRQDDVIKELKEWRERKGWLDGI